MGDTYVGLFTDLTYPEEILKKTPRFEMVCQFFIQQFYRVKLLVMGYGLELRSAVITIRNKITPRDIEWMEWCGFIQNSDWYINTYAHCNRNILTLDWTMKFVKKTFKII